MTHWNLHYSRHLGCARFPQFVQNFSERQTLWSLCSVDFHTLTLQLPIQTPYFVAPELQVFVSSLENCQNFGKTSTPQVQSPDIAEEFISPLKCGVPRNPETGTFLRKIIVGSSKKAIDLRQKMKKKNVFAV